MPIPTTLEILRERLRLSKQTVGSSPGPLPTAPQAVVEAHLEFAKTSIASILEEIDNVGSADTTVPDTLPEIAEACDELAHAALKAAINEPIGYEEIGSALKTVDFFIDANEGYRERAGIT